MDLISREAVLDETIRRNSIWKGITNSRGENLEQIINRLPTIQPKIDGDYISRKALMSHIENQSREWGDDYDTEQILSDIEDFPSIQPKKGEWIYSDLLRVKHGTMSIDALIDKVYADMRGDKE